MPRGRPRKDATANNTKDKVIKPKILPPKNEQVGELQTKAKTAPPKKRGRKKKVQELLMKPEDVIDYMIRNYPKMGIEKIKDSVVNGLKNRETDVEQIYVLDEIVINGDIYFCDQKGNVLNDDARICGFVIDSDTDSDEGSDPTKTYEKGKTQDSKTVRVQMFHAQSDDRTFKQVVNSIEKL
jgi:hypothetical protein